MLVKKIMTEILSWSKALVVAFTISIFISAFVIQPFTVNGSSMEPTFTGEDLEDEEKIGDRIFINKSAYLLNDGPKINDIVVIDSRINRKRTLKDHFIESPFVSLFVDNNLEKIYWVKRVIGEAGDTIEFKDGSVYRNGTKLVEKYIKEQMEFPFETVVVPENYIFVMGDNRNGSNDSRNIGPIPVENVLGKVLLRYFPLHKIQTF